MHEIGFIASIMAIPLGLWAFFFISINLQSILYSFQNIDIHGVVEWVGLDNYSKFLADLFGGVESDLVVYSLFNSVKWWFLNLVLTTPINLAFSYYIFLNYKGSKFFRIVAMTPVIISGLIFSLLFQKTMNTSFSALLKSFGMTTANFFTDEKWALPINVFYSLWSGLTTSLIIIPNAMKEAGPEIIEASEIDGAGIYARFWYIVLPIYFPVQVTTWVMGIAGMFSTSYNLVTFYQYGAPESLYTLGYYFTVKVMTGNTMVEYPYMAAAGMCLTVLATTVTLTAKHFLLKLQDKVV